MTGELEPRSAWVVENCPIARTFEVIGTKTSYLIMREAFYGATRFEEFVERTGVSEPVAAARLRDLTEEGLLEKVPYREPGQRTRNEYRLTEKGTDFLPVLVAMMRWGAKWLFPDGDGTRLSLQHTGCGAPVSTALHCDAGHEVPPNELQLGLRPA